jgi:catechol 2,3-dioxygenase-like lactoylglutathione lyase family enzyme
MVVRTRKELPMTVTVRYIVTDVQKAVDFYVDRLGFDVVLHPGPGFALLGRKELRLGLSAIGGEGGGSRATGAAEAPAPGGWNRFQIEVNDLASLMEELKGQRVPFRTDLVEGRGGRQALIEDPSGNPVELFEPAAR